MSKKYVIAIMLILILCISFLSVYIYRINDVREIGVECVASQEDAIAIAKIICQSVYPQFDYTQYKWKCMYNEHKNDLYDEDVWIVWCSEGETVLGGGLPEVHIKKSNAQVVAIMLAA